MRNITSSDPKLSVCAGFAVVLTALIGWSIDLHTAYIGTSTGETVASESSLANTSASDRGERA